MLFFSFKRHSSLGCGLAAPVSQGYVASLWFAAMLIRPSLHVTLNNLKLRRLTWQTLKTLKLSYLMVINLDINNSPAPSSIPLCNVTTASWPVRSLMPVFVFEVQSGQVSGGHLVISHTG